MACSNFSFRSSDTIGHLFQAMFPDSEIAKSFSLGHTKASYIIGEGMLPYFTEVFVNDLKKSDLPFSVHFDETTTSQVKKQMDITLRYWSQKHERCGLCFIHHCSLDMLMVKLWPRQCTAKWLKMACLLTKWQPW